MMGRAVVAIAAAGYLFVSAWAIVDLFGMPPVSPPALACPTGQLEPIACTGGDGR